MKRLILAFFIGILSLQIIEAQIPQTMSYQGIIRDNDGAFVKDGIYTLNFNLYDVSIGGTSIWSEQQSVSVKNGIMNVILGSNKPLNISFDKQYWLGIAIGDGGELTPRMQLTSSPYSLNAKSVADSVITAGKIPAGQVVKSINNFKDQVTLEAGDNVTITNTNNKVRISAAGVGSNVVSSINTYLKGDVKIEAGSNIDITQSILNNKLTISATSTGGLTLPYTGSTTSSNDAFTIYNFGSGGSGDFSNSGSQPALSGYTQGSSWAGIFTISNSINSSPAIAASTNGTGPTGFFYGSGNDSQGIYVSVPSGKTGLYVSGGTKNAIVATTKGARKLYTEESTEVWFTDYGFGTLQSGITSISIDPLFAETVNLSEKYHVFLQSYSDAELYVSKRTTSQFEVKMRSGDPNAEFSYRIVAKRKGYEIARLEYEPSGDEDPNLYPEQRMRSGAQKITSESIFFQMQKELAAQKKKFENK
ncbi:MAG: hypothetical protein Q8O92_16485 [Candidatus Latescibacter sp.]|nr:hypothetical protein [Candidatus Latescibacter sp.]